jgi:hypothetical protein
MGTGGALTPRIKWLGRESDHSPPSSAEIKNVVWCLDKHRDNFTFTFQTFHRTPWILNETSQKNTNKILALAGFEPAFPVFKLLKVLRSHCDGPEYNAIQENSTPFQGIEARLPLPLKNLPQHLICKLHDSSHNHWQYKVMKQHHT